MCIIETIKRHILPDGDSFEDKEVLNTYLDREMKNSQEADIILAHMHSEDCPFYSYTYKSARIDMLIKFFDMFKRMPKKKMSYFLMYLVWPM